MQIENLIENLEEKLRVAQELLVDVVKNFNNDVLEDIVVYLEDEELI